MSNRFGPWKPYVPVAQRRAKAARQTEKLARRLGDMQPVRIEGRHIALSFWGKGWCRHLESFSDFENRLPRGRSYVRNNAVCDLRIESGRIEARVIGSEMYRVEIDITPFGAAAWDALKRQCAGEIESLLALLQGRLSEPVMRAVANREQGLFPRPGEMKLRCSCPDWAEMCKHVAAALYGIGNRLDHQPELLFQLRGVDAVELIDSGFTAPSADRASADGALAADQLGAIFGVEFDETPAAAPQAVKKKTAAAPARKVSKRAAAEFIPTGDAVAALRKRLGLSRSAFGMKLDVTGPTIKRWESLGPARLNAHPDSLTALKRLHRRTMRERS
ncbi:SWIM zinc finger family protein [Algiphilus sp. W345]|uniref:SWIM zinc finger family protein n=1 Tax=Banduia mediterranea TaxID=3075609 RepID=A0ABU2WMJ6_9GAMM|nr:SWIM zinc finger family protein [Algiphilus sp. W345]MDT0499102.1 SWIM zinc finger family protein [Algiphilus sp. W345]